MAQLKANLVAAKAKLAQAEAEGKAAASSKSDAPTAKKVAAAPAGAAKPNLQFRKQQATSTKSATVTKTVPTSKIPTVPEGDDEPEEFEEETSSRQKLVWLGTSCAISMLVHMIVLLLLGMWNMAQAPKNDQRNLVATNVSDQPTELEEAVVQQEMEVSQVDTGVSMVAQLTPMAVEMPVNPAPTMTPVEIKVPDLTSQAFMQMDLTARLGTGDSKSMSGHRGEGGRKAALAANGGNDITEAAVARGLAWLAKHQLPDGSWTFALDDCPTCRGKCKGSGTMGTAKNAATAMGVLPFLAAGQTHKIGKYKQNVQAALFYLVSHEKATSNGGELVEGGGTMYSHGLASIALCEAYAMTKDKTLGGAAQGALNYIMAAQDLQNGGWRYGFRQGGDTSVVGWQVMSLKSGQMGLLSVNPKTMIGAAQFLDSVQAEGGAKYGYDKPGATPTMTAVGLLCRMYMGWKRDNPNLIKGVEYLSKIGPSKDDLYFNYYATQVLMQYDGELWVRWNDKMRQQLVDTQADSGHADGSWLSEGGHNGPGGRLYCTSLSTLTLEVYYRHLPLYSADGDKNDKDN